ncbi:SET domain [Sesbania bispinosa]|nr:SET domain [Sesbania bispinosa]
MSSGYELQSTFRKRVAFLLAAFIFHVDSRDGHRQAAVPWLEQPGPGAITTPMTIAFQFLLQNLLQSETEGVNDEKIGFYGRCALHANGPTCQSSYDSIDEMGSQEEKKFTCARTEGYKGRRWDGFQNNHYRALKAKRGCLVPEEQLNAWIHINGQKLCSQGLTKFPDSDIEHDCRKEYARYKQAKGWKRLVVYKSGIHALGLYTSRFISRGEMVVEYVGEIVGLRVADKRENEYHSGRKLQYKSACYFFRIDKEHIIDATRKGGIARFVNHSCLPNCVAKVITIRHEKKGGDIFPGEEITYDYHFNHEDEGKKIPCYCNSKNCRRYLN